MSELLQAALWYAERGVKVFPCAGKGPAIEGGGGCYDATTDPEVIRGWWTERPAANVGVAAGGSGLVVLDPDGPQGRNVFARLGNEHGAWPETFVVTTPYRGGGEHWYYRMPKDVRIGCRNLDHAVNAKGLGGYVLAPPSIHPKTGTRYTIRGGSLLHLPELPAWAAARLASAPRSAVPPPAPRPLKDPMGTKYGRVAVREWRAKLEAAPQGSRHNTLLDAAVRLQSLVLGGELPTQVLDELVTIGHNIGLPEAESAGVVAWARAKVTNPASAPRRNRRRARSARSKPTRRRRGQPRQPN